MNKRTPIAVLLSTVFAVAVVFAVGLVVLNTVSEFGTARSNSVAALQRDAAAQAADLSTMLQTSIPGSLGSLVAEPGIHGLHPAACAVELDSLLKFVPTARGAVLRADGSPVCRSAAWRPVGRPDWIVTASTTGYGYGGPVVDPVTGTPFIGYALAFTSSSGVPAMLVMLEPTQGNLLSQPTDHLTVALADVRTGKVLDGRTANATTGRAAGTLVPARFVRANARTVTTVKIGGVTSLAAKSAVAHTDWVVVAAIPESHALAAAYRNLVINGLYGALMVAVVIVLAWVLNRRIARPLRRLRRAIDEMAEADIGGNGDATRTRVPEVGPRELAELGGAFNLMADARERSESRLATLVRHGSDLVLVADAEGILSYATPSVTSMSGLAADAVVGTPLSALVHPDDRELVATHFRRWVAADAGGGSRLDFRLTDADGRARDVEAQVQNLVDDPAIRGLVVTCHDITERKAAENELAHAALHDALTGLPNRALVLDRLGHLLARTGRSGAPSAVLFIDLDRFKLVNDSSGHASGDALLVQVGRRLESVVRPGDTLGRFGGDEFVVICDSLERPESATVVAQRLLDAMADPFEVEDQEMFVTASIGIAVAGPGDEAGDLLRDADAALYRAKETGRASYAVFDDGMREQVRRRLDVGNGLRRALDAESLFLEFQPVMSLGSGAAVGAEALVRWRSDNPAGVVPPDAFIPIAEETGLIVPIGEWVLREACRTLHAWRGNSEFPSDTRLSVNVSARQLVRPSFVDAVATALADTHLDPSSLVLEVTESTLMQDREAASRVLRDLRGLGVSVSVDDFGMGYSSLAYLERLPLDEVKIDRSFVSRLDYGRRARPIVASIVDLAHAVGVEVVAEGVEHDAQRALLAEIGCDRAQGFLFARPLPAVLAYRFLVDHRNEAARREAGVH